MSPTGSKQAPRGGKMGPLGKHRGKGANRVVDVDNWKGLTEPAIRRLLRKGGILRANGDVYEDARDVIKAFLTLILKDAMAYTDHARRKTITAIDIKHALDRNNIKYYACGTDKK